MQITVARAPRVLTECNCSICRRYGALWAYYTRPSVTVEAARGVVVAYSTRPRGRRFMHCSVCGGLTHYEGPRDWLAVNARMMDPQAVAAIAIKLLDGDRTWKTLERAPHPGRFMSPAPRSRRRG